MARIKMNFKGFDTVLKTINEMGLNAHDEMDKALLECHELITKQVNQEMTRYDKNTGAMEESIFKDNKTSWNSEKGSVVTGFNQNQSMHATYMMITGTPHRAPDKNLYNAIYGAKTKKAIKEIQEKALMRVIEGGNK